jgi:hypothetical protein
MEIEIEVPGEKEMYQVSYLVMKGWTYNIWGKEWTKEGNKQTKWDYRYGRDNKEESPSFTLDEAYDFQEREDEAEKRAKKEAHDREYPPHPVIEAIEAAQKTVSPRYAYPPSAAKALKPKKTKERKSR